MINTKIIKLIVLKIQVILFIFMFYHIFNVSTINMYYFYKKKKYGKKKTPQGVSRYNRKKLERNLKAKSILWLHDGMMDDIFFSLFLPVGLQS